jgi:hypothetical protein
VNARRFNDQGLAQFSEYVTHARALWRSKTEVPPVPPELVDDPATSEPLEYVLPDAEPNFPTKLAIGEFVAGIVPEAAFERARVDASFWTWLSARYFDQITANRTKLKEPRAYVAGLSFQEFYRHIILGSAYLFFSAGGDPSRIKVLLYDEPTTMNEVMVQFGSYQTLMQNRELQGVIQRLYFDEAQQRIKRGAGGKNAGTPRRLMSFLRQIELNYDLGSIRAEQFCSMLPREFQRFLA